MNVFQLNRQSYLIRQWVTLSLILFVFGCLIALSQWMEYEHLQQQEIDRLTAQAEVLKLNIEPPLQTVDRVIDDVINRIEFSPATHSILKTISNLHLVAIDSATRGLIQPISVVDADGVIIASSNEMLVGKSLREQSFFKLGLQNSDPDVLHISAPYKVPGEAIHAISLFKTVFDPFGNYAGMVMATLVPEHFATLLGSMHYSPDIRSSIIHSDGILFQMAPASLAHSGENLAATNTFFKRHQDSGKPATVHSGLSRATGENRIVALRTVSMADVGIDKPLVVAVSRNIDRAVLEPWKKNANAQGLLFGTIALISCVVLALAQRWQSKVHEEKQNDALALERANRSLLTLSACNEALVRNINQADLLASICRLIVEKGQYRMAWVGMPDSEKYPEKVIRPVAHYGFEDGYLSVMKFSWADDSEFGQGPVGRAMRTGNIQVNQSFQTASPMLPWRAAALERSYHASIGLPLKSGEKVLGVLSIYASEPDAFDRDECKLLQELADNLAFGMAALQIQLERKRVQEQLNIAAVAFDSQEGIMITDANQMILNVNQAFTEITGYRADEVIGQKSNMLQSGRHDRAFFHSLHISLVEHGTWQGEIWNKRKNGEIYPEWLIITAVKDHSGVITHFVGSFTDMTARKQAEEKIHQLAFYDTLTKLSNRQLLLENMQDALTRSAHSKNYCALMQINLDHFMTLNDTLGHEVGDQLLQQISHQLVEIVGETGFVARLGGDEFVVLMENLSWNFQDAADHTDVLGEKVLNELSRVYQLSDYSYRSTSSVGICIFSGHQQDTLDEILKMADLALHHAKQAGRNTLRFFAPQMKANVSARALLESDLREAIRKSEFVLFYQAQLGEHGKVMGVEALLRWHSPVRGLVPPDQFIPVAEDTGLILPIGKWVLRTACTQLAAWAVQPDMSHLTMSVNVSARQFHQADFVSQVTAALDFSGANPKLLELELTESMLLSDVEDTIRKMTVLRQKGVSFALDDFGTGYSSLSILKALPLDRLKIDKSFVLELPNNQSACSIARIIIQLGKSLGLMIIAEGVENKQQFRFLAEEGCYAHQGYLFNRPMPIAEFIKFMITPPNKPLLP